MAAPLPRAVIDMMAKREHRMHHWLWHEVRNGWHEYPKDVQAKLADLGWRPPRPLMDEAGRPNLRSYAGEDFLYMHRQMIADVNAVLATAGDPNYKRIEGWTVVPPPGDPDYPVPPVWFNPSIQPFLPISTLRRIKSDVYYYKRFLFWQRTFTDPSFLQRVTLAELGVLIELTIHNMMHLRWGASPGSSFPSPDNPTLGEDIPPEFDDPRYDFLVETYSSHVHPIFWKLHGWIDDRVEDWRVANGVAEHDFWTGTWVGKMPGHDAQAPMAMPVRAPPPAEGPMPVAASIPGVHLQMEQPQASMRHLSEVEEAVLVVRRSGVALVPFAQFVLD